MEAYAIDPVQVPVAPKETRPARPLQWRVSLPGAHRAVWALVDQAEGNPIRGGTVTVTDGVATIDAAFRPANRIFTRVIWLVVVLGACSLRNDQPLHLWKGFAEFQQGLVASLKAVRWGPGLRLMRTRCRRPDPRERE